MLSLLLKLFIGAAVIYAAILTVNSIRDWFRSRTALFAGDRNKLAFTLKEKLQNGQYAIYQGILDQASETLVDGQKIVTSSLDSQMASIHAQEELVIYS
jgi:hypothetical protein